MMGPTVWPLSVSIEKRIQVWKLEYCENRGRSFMSLFVYPCSKLLVVSFLEQGGSLEFGLEAGVM